MLKFDSWWMALVYLMYVGCLVIYPYYPAFIWRLYIAYRRNETCQCDDRSDGPDLRSLDNT
jgi:hypothetical protein